MQLLRRGTAESPIDQNVVGNLGLCTLTESFQSTRTDHFDLLQQRVAKIRTLFKNPVEVSDDSHERRVLCKQFAHL
jgi:hypothetical protein